MVARNASSGKQKLERKIKPATTPEGQETLMISRAMQLAEKQIEEGTASAQVITHFLKLGTTRERLEQQRLQHENELLKKKAEAMESAKEVEALYREALNAMRSYNGEETDINEQED